MGQKTHPIGLRVGIYRKWNTTWFVEKNNYKSEFFTQIQVEQFFKYFFYFYSYTKISKTKRVWLVDLKWYRLGMLQIYIFIFFYKFRSTREDISRKSKKKYNSMSGKNKAYIKYSKERKVNLLNDFYA